MDEKDILASLGQTLESEQLLQVLLRCLLPRSTRQVGVNSLLDKLLLQFGRHFVKAKLVRSVTALLRYPVARSFTTMSLDFRLCL